MNAEQFNALYPVGTPVFAYPGFRPEDASDARRLVTRTRTAAQVSPSGAPVVWVEREGAYICLTHVDPVAEDVWEEARSAEKPTEPSSTDAPVELDDQRLAESLAAYEGHPDLGFACCSAHAVADHVPALLAEVQRLKAELADFSGRVNELESRLCDCEPVREHNDYKRPAFYQHEAHCPVSNPAKEAVS